MGDKTKWVIAWDFSKRPRAAFYNVLRDEFAEIEHVQRSVGVVRDDFTARRLRALLEYYGANVCAWAVNGARLDDARADREAQDFVERVHKQRLARRGRRAG